MNKIKKAVIPAAGCGTRFLPITKTLAKEMLPIIDIPNLEYIARECKDSGIEELILVVNSEKREILEYFSHNYKLEKFLAEKGKYKELDYIKKVSELIKITFVYQQSPLGLGHAIMCAKNAIKGEDFAVLLGDDLVMSDVPAIKQLINAYEFTRTSIIGVQKVPHNQTYRYGILDYKRQIENSLYEVNSFVEKPSIEDAPSDFACVGRYVFTNNIFNEIENVNKDSSGEYQLTDAMVGLLSKEDMFACEFKGTRYDIGDKLGYIKAIIDFSLKRDDLKDEVKEYLINKVKEI